MSEPFIFTPLYNNSVLLSIARENNCAEETKLKKRRMICAGNIFTPVLLSGVATGILLFPGFILNLPPIPQSPEYNTLAKRTFFTGRLTGWNVIVHGLIFLIVWGLILSAILKNAGICMNASALRSSVIAPAVGTSAAAARWVPATGTLYCSKVGK